MKFLRNGATPIAAACLLALATAASAGTYNTTVVIKPFSSTTPVNKLVTGTSIHWAAYGDGIYDPATGNFNSTAIAKILEQKPATLRYPGGTLSDTYHWQNGMGPTRQPNVIAYDNTDQVVDFGTREFLELCEAVGSEPVITVNVMTGTAAEAANWVHEVNVAGLTSSKTGLPLPKVKRWEIGNEPYLPNAVVPAMDPLVYAQKAAEFIAAMKAVDSTIKTGVALRGDPIYMYNIPVPPGYVQRNRETDAPPPPHVGGSYVPWNRPVLNALRSAGAAVDFASTHAGYGPYWFERGATDPLTYPADPAESYRQALAQSTATAQQLNAVKADMTAANFTKPIFNSEFGPIFRLGPPGSPQNAYGASFTGALMVADHLAMFGSRPDVALASRWSLMGNAYWGGLTASGAPRPVHYVLKEFARIQKGYNLTVELPAIPTFDTPYFGRNWPQVGVPKLAAFGALDRTTDTYVPATARVMLINRSPTDTANITLYGLGGSGGRKSLGTSVAGTLLANAPGDSYLSSSLPQSTPVSLATSDCVGPVFTACQLSYQLPPHSVVFLDIGLVNSN